MNSVDLAGDILVQNIVVISGARARGRTFTMPESGRGSHGFLYIWNGEATFYQDDGNTVRAIDGQLLYLPKAARYKIRYAAESTTFVTVNFDLLGDLLCLFRTNGITILADKDSADTIANIMKKFVACGPEQTLSGQFRRKELFYRLLSVIHDNNPGAESQQYPQIMKGVMLLKQTYLENLPIGMFAKESNVSISSFRQLFHKQYGMSPVQYRNALRIRRARQLLEDGGGTVAEVAYACGFENIGYFCRYYKKVTGETPQQTRLRNF